MKKLLSLLTIALVAIAMAFVGCKKDDKNDDGGGGNGGGNGGGGGGGGGTSGVVIEANSIEGMSSNVAKIAAQIVYLEDTSEKWYTLASANYNNGFKLTLPNSFPEEHMIELKNSDAKQGIFLLCALDNNGNQIGTISLCDGSDHINYYEDYTYVTKDINYKTSYDYTYADGKLYLLWNYDCAYKKGWNINYRKTEYVFEPEMDKMFFTITSQKPAGINLKWVFSPNSSKTYKNEIELQKMQSVQR
jgi:hypothetical protein